MSDPKLTRVRVVVTYSADDGYFSETTFSMNARASLPAQVALLDAIDELSRIAALFGFADEARAKFDAAQARVADFKAKRGAA